MALTTGASSLPVPAELAWPGDPCAFSHEVSEAAGTWASPRTAWPATLAELCGHLPGTAAPPPAPMHEPCREYAPPAPYRVSLAFGSYGLGRLAPIAETFEIFEPGWISMRADPEAARAWTEVPPALQLELAHSPTERTRLHIRVGLRRDLAAWREDALGLNLPAGEAEVDLNEPSLGYFHWAGHPFTFTAGRFPVHWGPSPDFGLALSRAVPYHNGALAAVRMGQAHYYFLISTLNPWLEGTPPGDTAGEDYPPGSEEWRQRHYPDIGGTSTAHRRVYAERAKTLVAHRLELVLGAVALGLTETQVVGGKVPDLRDANPFAVFHNDFHEGYANNNVSLDAGARLPRGFTLAAELFLDDVEYSDTEGEGSTPSLIGWLAGIRHAAALRGWGIIQSLHAVRTDPFLYAYLQPLNTYVSRHVLTSNYRGPGEDPLIDKYVVDYPLGYLRGGDALDFWYRVEARRGRALRLGAEAALLSRGEAGTGADFTGYYRPHGSSPSGRSEDELRLSADGAWRARSGLGISAGAGWSRLKDRAGRDRGRARFELGTSWIHPW